MMCEHGASDNDCDAGFPAVCAYPGCGYFGHDEHSAPDYCSRHKPAEPVDLPPSDNVEIMPDDDSVCGACQGSGWGSGPTPCSACGGTGNDYRDA